MRFPVVGEGWQGVAQMLFGKGSLSHGEGTQGKVVHGVEVLPGGNIHRYGVRSGVRWPGAPVVLHRNGAHLGVAVAQRWGGNSLRCSVVGGAVQGEYQVRCRRGDWVDVERTQVKLDGGVEVLPAFNICRYVVLSCIGGLVCVVVVPHRDGAHSGIG